MILQKVNILHTSFALLTRVLLSALLLVCAFAAESFAASAPALTPDPIPEPKPVPIRVAAPPLPIDTAFYDRYSFIRFVDSSEDADLVQLTDDDFLDHAGKIIFRVNSYNVLTNDSLLKELEEVIIPRINRDSLRLCRMVLRGAASPEGPVDNNRILGRRRMETLALFLRARLSIPVDDNFTTETVAEDYGLLSTMMRRANDPALETVKALCDQYLPRYEYAALKQQLQKVDRGRLWRRLLRDYFPELRAARLVLFFEKAVEEAPVEPEPPVIPEPPVVVPPAPVIVPDTFVVQRCELLSVKTNVLLDFAYVPVYNRWCPIPNIAIEFYPKHGHFTFGASFDCPWWQHYDEHKFFQVRNYQLEGRYYFKTRHSQECHEAHGTQEYHKPHFSGLYLSAYVHATRFGVCFDADHGWVGEGGGAGLGVGYVLPLSKDGRWRMEFAAQGGFFRCQNDPYQFENPVDPNYRDGLYYYKWTGKPADFKKRQYRWNWLGPTRIGITISYDLLYRRIKKKGVSFRHSERIVEEVPVLPTKE